MPPDAATYAMQSDPDRNPAFRRRWDEPELPGDPGQLSQPFVSAGEAAQRVVMRAASEARLQRQIREIFGE